MVHLYVWFQGRGGEGGGKGSGLVEPHADTPVLMETEEDVALSARQQAQERRRVSLESQRADGLSDLHIHDDDLSRVHDEEVVLVGRGEDYLTAVYLCDTLLPSVC